MPDESFNMGWGVQGSDLALAALQQIAAGIDKIAAKGKETEQATGNMFTKGIEGAQQFALGLVGAQSLIQALQTTLRLVTNEWDNWQARARKAADTQIGAAQAEAGFIRTLGAAPPAEIQTRLAQVGAMNQAGMPRVAAYQLSASIMGARGELTPEQGMSLAAEIGKRYQLETPASQQAAARGASQLMNAFRISAAEAVAAQEAAMGPAINRDIESFGQYLLPQATIAARGNRASFRSVMGLGITLQQLTGDVSSRPTATSLSRLTIENLKLAREAGYMGSEDPREVEKFLFAAPQGEAARRKLLGKFWSAAPGEGDAAAADAFTGKFGVTGEARFLGALISYYRGDEAFRTRRAGIEREVYAPGDPAALALANQREQLRLGLPTQQAAILQRKLQGATETTLARDTQAGIQGAFAGEFTNFLQSMGYSDLSQRIHGAATSVDFLRAKSPVEALDVGIRAVESMKARNPAWEAGMRPWFGKSQFNEHGLWPEQQKANDLLDDILQELRAQRENLGGHTLKLRDADGVERPAAAAVEGVGT